MIESTYRDYGGREHVVPSGTIAALQEAMGDDQDAGTVILHPGETRQLGGHLVLEDGTDLGLVDEAPPDLPLGYHRLVHEDGDRPLIVSPGRCFLPPERQWGWSAQLYATRSTRSWGMGDLEDLAFLAEWSRDLGAGTVLINPICAVAPTSPRQASPYFPASRRFLDPIYIRVSRVPGASLVPAAIEEAERAGVSLNRLPLLDREAVWDVKSRALESIWAGSDPPPQFERWLADQSPSLELFAGWSVLAERHGGDWREWPAAYRRPDARQVRTFFEENRNRVRFHQWLQWLTRLQLEEASRRLTLVQDLPIGFDPGGMDAWEWQDLIASGVSVGAPPDEFNTLGQNWGLPPFVPTRLAAAGYRPLVETIRAGLLNGGGLRIDHVLGLFRQFWIPKGASPGEGAYVRYPADDLLDIIALESVRARAVIVGEDLGTVERGVRAELAERRLLSYRLLWFEEDHPATWPQLSMASVTTHDLPTIAGLWTGSDLAEQEALDLQPNRESTEAIRSRVAAIVAGDPTGTRKVIAAVHAHLAAAPSLLACAALDDLAGMERRPNMPGSDGRRPNWKLPLERTLEDLVADPLAEEISAALRRDAST